MPDISMCQGGPCPDKAKCYRFAAVPNEYRQSYAQFHLTLAPGATRCEDFTPLYPEQEARRVPRA